MIYFQSLTRQDLADLILPLSRKPRSAAVLIAPEASLAAASNPLVSLTPAEQDEKQAEAYFEEKAKRQAQVRARQIFRWVYQQHQRDWDQMSDLSKPLRAWLKERVSFFELKEQTNQQALDGTHKFLWQLEDHKTIESVVIPAALKTKLSENHEEDHESETDEDEEEIQVSPQTPSRPGQTDSLTGAPTRQTVSSPHWKRLTACISSQVGCAMACKFCLTGVQGLDRHLQVHEIVEQISNLRRKAPLTNIVFMGMGEPLHNFDAVVKACEIFLDPYGLAFSKRKITISTSGLVPAIEALGKKMDVSLAISLNATTDEQRSLIMPINKKWNIEKLLDACKAYPLGSHRRITFEYVLLQGVNDTLEDAARLVSLTRHIPSKINLIPFNEHSGSTFLRPQESVVRAFQNYLLQHRITATVRISRGRDILAACGQLRSIFGSARGSERHQDWKAS